MSESIALKPFLAMNFSLLDAAFALLCEYRVRCRSAIHHEVAMSLRSSTEYEIAALPALQGCSLDSSCRQRPPSREGGMDTGFRRYDGSRMPIRRPDGTCTCIV